MEKINVIVSFSNSKKYTTDWKVRYCYKNGYKDVLIHDNISKETRFGIEPSKILMQEYATIEVNNLAKAFGFEVEKINFVG